MYSDFEKIVKEKGLKVSDVARGTGIKQGVFSDWKAGRYTPKQDKMNSIADFLGVSVEQFASKESASRQHYWSYRDTVAKFKEKGTATQIFGEKGKGMGFYFHIPVLGRVAAGIPIEAQEEILDWEEITPQMAFDGEYFALQIQGDSMEPKFSNGDVVIVRQQEDADDGDIVIALVNGNDAVCKRLKKYEDGIALVSTNPAYDPMYFSGAEVTETPVKIIGKVKELRAKF